MMTILQLRRIRLPVVTLLLLAIHHAIAYDIPSTFPVSTRQALLKKSQQIVDTVGYTTAGFSNRKGLVVTPLHVDDSNHDNNVYAADRPFLWNNIDVMGRMAVVELPSSCDSNNDNSNSKPDLWIHSPVALDGPLQQAIDSIGTVRHIVSPNYEHVAFAAQWKQAYPKAELWGCPGLAAKMPDVAWSGEIPQGYRPSGFDSGSGASKSSSTASSNSKLWDTSLIECLHVDMEINPLTRKPFFNECIFYHAPSKSLITTDFFWNYPASSIPNSQFGRDDSWDLAPTVDKVPLPSRLWKFGMDKVYLPFFDSFMVQDKEAYQRLLHHVVNVWDIQMIVPAHGDVIRGKDLARTALKKFFNYKGGA